MRSESERECTVPTWRAYVFAACGVGVALLLRQAADPVLGDAIPMFTFFLAIIFAAWLGGTGPTLMAVVASMCVGVWFFVTPRYSFDVPTSTQKLGLMSFAISGVGVAALGAKVAAGRSAGETVVAKKREIAQLAGKLVHAQEEERRRLARELHDDFSQRLALAAWELHDLEVAPDVRRTHADSLHDIRQNLTQMSQDLHTFSRQLHPSILDDLGLVDALRAECDRFARCEHVTIHFRAHDLPMSLDANVALAIYRVVQEALKNIGKHSQSQQAFVTVQNSEGMLRVTIEDAGVGFDVGKLTGKPTLGLDSMRERMQLVGGDVTIHSVPGAGTLVAAAVPAAGTSA